MQPDGLRTVYRYDAEGNEILRTDSAGREAAYEYDERHNRTVERMADGLQVRENRSVYDWMGRLTESVDAEGNRTQYQYGEAGGKPSVIRFADGDTCSFEYDKAGRMMAQEDACGRNMRMTRTATWYTYTWNVQTVRYWQTYIIPTT